MCELMDKIRIQGVSAAHRRECCPHAIGLIRLARCSPDADSDPRKLSLRAEGNYHSEVIAIEHSELMTITKSSFFEMPTSMNRNGFGRENWRHQYASHRQRHRAFKRLAPSLCRAEQRKVTLNLRIRCYGTPKSSRKKRPEISPGGLLGGHLRLASLPETRRGRVQRTSI